MTPFLTALVVSASFNGEPTVMAVIPFPSRAECEAAVDPIFAATAGAFLGVLVQCVDSRALAISEIPKWRNE